jgi:hypothetical protein
MSHLSLDFSFWKAALCVIAVGFTIYSMIKNIKYSDKKKSVWFLEGLRLAILALFLITFLEPEWVKVNNKKDLPELVVAWDDSNSMNTEDVVVDGKVIDRQTMAKRILESATMKELAKKFKIKTVSFSGLEQNKSATNLNGLLKSQIENDEFPRAMILVGDGDWNEGGDPLETAVQYRGNVPVFTVATGSETFLPDVALKNVQPPVFGLINEKISIPYRVFNHLEKDLKSKITLQSLTGEKVEKAISVASGRFTDSNIVWKPTKAGMYEFKISIPIEEGEYVKTNNEAIFKIEIKEEKLKVLIVESWPRWEYRFLRNALMRDPGVEVNTVLYQLKDMKAGAGLGYLPEFPQTKEELSKYDVVFLGDVKIGGGQLTKQNLLMLNGLVKSQGSGLVFLPGHQGNQITFSMLEESDEMLPVVYDKKRKGYGLKKESFLFLTYEGKDHHLTMLADKAENNRELWKSLPGFNWSSAVIKAKEGTNVLAVHSSMSNKWGRLPMIVTKPFGNGYTLFMGTDSAYKWRHGVEDKYHYRFWGQVVRWMSHKRHISSDKNIRLFYNPETPKQGDTVNLQATIHDNSRLPLNGALVNCEIISPDGSKEEFMMNNTDNDWGVYKGEFKTIDAGRYKVRVKVPKSGFKHELIIDVYKEGVETVGQPGRFNVLKEIASLSKGEFIPHDQFQTLAAKLQDLPEPKIREKRYRLWNQAWWAGLIILLLTVHWTVSKKMGMM